MTLTTEPTLDTHDFCDRHNGWVAQGTTRAMDRNSPYRICEACLRSLRQTWCPRCKQPFARHPRPGQCPRRAA